MNWSSVGTALAVLGLVGLVAGAAATLLGGGILGTRSGVSVLAVVVAVVAVLAVAGTAAAGRVRNPYW